MVTRLERPPVLVLLDEPRRLVREHLQRALAADRRVRVLPATGSGQHSDATPPDVVVSSSTPARPAESPPHLSLEQYDLAEPAAAVTALLRTARSGRAEAPGPDRLRAMGRPERPRDLPRPLSAYERAVVDGLGRGSTAADVARDLGASPKSVENAKRRAFAKLGARSQAEAVFLAGCG